MQTTIVRRTGTEDWPDFASFRPYPPAATLKRWLADAHARTRSLFEGLDSARMRVPLLAVVNPPVWELGHIAWFYEFWILRRGDFDAPALLPGADALYDSSRVPHDSRWQLGLPDLEATWRYAERVQDAALALIDRDDIGDELAYFAALAVFHHDMHNEAFCYMWQTLGYPCPGASAAPEESAAPRTAGAPGECAVPRTPAVPLEAGDAGMPAAVFELGARPGSGFVFDNEKWAHPVTVPAFAIGRQAVSNAEFLAFVEEGGYRRAEFWSEEGAGMLAREGLAAPRYWRRDAGQWLTRRFDRVLPLPPDEPVRHVSLHEAEAWCRWAGRRLPTEAEWERAGAAGLLDRAKRRYSSTWEWTASRFLPYPGFAADPYRDYSAPWYVEHHQVLRGGSFATPPRLMRNTWRNFYRPGRADVFCGFRTCALDR